jgi:hypothetical protein
MVILEIIKSRGLDFVRGVPIEVLQLPPRAYNALVRADVYTVDQLFTKEGRFRYNFQRIGDAAHESIREAIHDPTIFHNIKQWQRTQKR